MNEFYLGNTVAILKLFPANYDAGVILVLLLRRCAPDWHRSGDFRGPDDIKLTSSVNSLALSIGRPYATVYRQVDFLLGCGLATHANGGVAISNSVDAAERIMSLLIAAHDGFVRLAEDLGPDVNFPRTDRLPAPDLALRTLTTALDLWVIPFEYAAEPVEDWTSRIVLLVILTANVRHVTTNPVLSDRFAVDPTPDDLRQPISVRHICRILGWSYGTVYRHCQQLALIGMAQYERGGWVLKTRPMLDSGVEKGTLALLEYFRKRITELVGAGFNLDDPSQLYRDGRPAYVDLVGR